MIITWYEDDDQPTAEELWQDNIDELRMRANGTAWWAQLAERFGLREFADRLQHAAKLDRMLADQQEAGLASGAYLYGHRQNPTVEEQCGCDRYCRPGRA